MKAIIAAVMFLVLGAFDSEAAEGKQPNRFSECVQKWRDMKAQPDYVYKKGGYKEHMSVCLKKEKVAEKED